MVYLICFFVSLMILVLLTAYGRNLDYTVILLAAAVTVSNAGHYCVSVASNPEEAILAVKISYASGMYAPMLTFIIVCTICRIELSELKRLIMAGVQTVLYVGVFTIGKYPYFYRSIDLITGPDGSYLEKTYGPMHTMYLVTMVFYVVASIVAGMISLNRKNTVSRINVEIVLFAEAVTVTVYLVERLFRLRYELMPVAFVVSMVIILIPLVKIYRYSLYHNTSIINDDRVMAGYIILDRRLRYRGCNDPAAELFPELRQWELEEKIPGNGGMFNTFLRQPLMSYVGNEETGDPVTKTFENKGKNYSFEIRTMKVKNRIKGYYIRISDITGLIRGQGS